MNIPDQRPLLFERLSVFIVISYHSDRQPNEEISNGTGPSEPRPGDGSSSSETPSPPPIHNSADRDGLSDLAVPQLHHRDSSSEKPAPDHSSKSEGKDRRKTSSNDAPYHPYLSELACLPARERGSSESWQQRIAIGLARLNYQLSEPAYLDHGFIRIVILDVDFALTKEGDIPWNLAKTKRTGGSIYISEQVLNEIQSLELRRLTQALRKLGLTVGIYHRGPYLAELGVVIAEKHSEARTNALTLLRQYSDEYISAVIQEQSKHQTKLPLVSLNKKSRQRGNKNKEPKLGAGDTSPDSAKPPSKRSKQSSPGAEPKSGSPILRVTVSIPPGAAIVGPESISEAPKPSADENGLQRPMDATPLMVPKIKVCSERDFVAPARVVKLDYSQHSAIVALKPVDCEQKNVQEFISCALIQATSRLGEFSAFEITDAESHFRVLVEVTGGVFVSSTTGGATDVIASKERFKSDHLKNFWSRLLLFGFEPVFLTDTDLRRWFIGIEIAPKAIDV